MTSRDIPTFYLYGEAHRAVAEDFVHAEALDDRSQPSGWTIKPHAHAELSHLFSLRTGGGIMRADSTELRFNAPCLLLIPATSVHGFEWADHTSGFVITMATRYLNELGKHDQPLAALFQQSRLIALEQEAAGMIDRFTETLMRELGWSAPGHRAAVDSAILALLVIALRHCAFDTASPPRPGHQAAMVARFRERVELRFRLRETVAIHAQALGVSRTALRMACARIAAASPGQMLDQRALLEARRALTYSNLSIAEIGFAIGFSDPAYFSRFFSRHAGMSPRDYRAARRKKSQTI